MPFEPVEYDPFASQEKPTQTSPIQKNLKPVDYDPFAVAPEADTGQGRISKSLERGVEGLKATGYGLAALGADVVGAEDFGTSMLEKYKQTEAKAQALASDVPTYKDIHSFGDAGKYAVDAVFENLIMFLPSLVTGGIGAAVARKGAEKLVADMVAKKMTEGLAKEAAEKAAAEMIAKRIALGSAAGAYVPSAGMEMGSIYGDIVDETGKRGGAGLGAAIAGGAAAGALDVVSAVPILGKVFGESAKEIAGSFIKRIGVEGTKQLLLEGGTEGLQTIIEQVSAQAGGSNKPIDWDEVVDAAIKGGIAGGVIGGGTEAVFGKTKKEKVETEPTGTVPTEQIAPEEAGITAPNKVFGLSDSKGIVSDKTIQSINKTEDGVVINYIDNNTGTQETKFLDDIKNRIAPASEGAKPFIETPPEAEVPPMSEQQLNELSGVERERVSVTTPPKPSPQANLELPNPKRIDQHLAEAKRLDQSIKDITASFEEAGKTIRPDTQRLLDDLATQRNYNFAEAQRLKESLSVKPIKLTPEEIAAAEESRLNVIAQKEAREKAAAAEKIAQQETAAAQRKAQVEEQKELTATDTDLSKVKPAERPETIVDYIVKIGGVKYDPKLSLKENGLSEIEGDAFDFLRRNKLLKRKGSPLNKIVNLVEGAGFLNAPTDESQTAITYGPSSSEDINKFINVLKLHNDQSPVFSSRTSEADVQAWKNHQNYLDEKRKARSFGLGKRGEYRASLANMGIETKNNITLEEAKKLFVAAKGKQREAAAAEQAAVQPAAVPEQRIKTPYDPFELVESSEEERADAAERASIQSEPSLAEQPSAEPNPFPPFETLGQEVLQSEQLNAANIEGDPPIEEARKFESAVEGKSLLEVAEYIAKTTNNESYREIAKKVAIRIKQLTNAGMKFSFRVAHVGETVPKGLNKSRGIATHPKENFKEVAVLLNGSDVIGKIGVQEETALHELIHAVTWSAITIGQKQTNTNLSKIVKDLEEVKDVFVKHLDQIFETPKNLNNFEKRIFYSREYFSNPNEIVAWALTNKDMQNLLEEIPYKNKSLFDKFVEIIRNALGLSPKYDTALSEVIRITGDLINADVNEIFPSAPSQNLAVQRPPMQGELFADQLASAIINGPTELPPLLNANGEDQTPAQTDAMAGKIANQIGVPPKPSGNPVRDIPYWGILTSTAANVARINKHFNNLYQTLIKKSQFEHFLVKNGEVKLQPMVDLPYNGRKKVEAVLEFARLTYTDIVPGADRIVVKIPENYNGVLAKPGSILALNKDETEAFNSAKSFFEQRWTELGRELAKKFGYDVAEDGSNWNLASINAAIEAMAKVNPSQKERLEKVRTIFNEVQRRKSYVPFFRYGDTGILVKPISGEEPVYFEMIDTSNAWGYFTGIDTKKDKMIQDRKAELVKKYPPNLYRITASDVTKDTLETISIPALEKMFAALSIKDKSLRDELYNSLLKQIQEAQMASITKESKNTPGYSTDFMRAMIDYNRLSANVVSGIRHKSEQEAFYERTQERDVPRNIRAYSKKYYDYIDSDERTIGRLKQFGFWANIWGSASSALVNLSQTPVITASQIAAWANFGSWGRTNALSLELLARSVRPTKNGFEMDISKINFDSKEEKEKFKDAHSRNVMAETITQDLRGGDITNFNKVAPKINRQTSEGLQKLIFRAFDIGASMFNVAEQVNRATAWLAAYREIQKPGALSKFKKMYGNDERVKAMALRGQLTPENIAEFITHETQFVGGKLDRPQIMRGAGGVVFQFKTYPIQYLRILKSNLFNQGPVGKVAALMMMSALLAAGGLLGLPFADDLLNLYDALLKKARNGIDPMGEYTLRNFIEKTGASPEWAEYMMRGPLRMFGIDVSNRIGQGQMLPEADLMMSVPILSSTLGKFQEYNARKQSGQPMGAAVALASPLLGKGLADIARGLLQLPKEGYRTQRGEFRVDRTKLTPGQIVAKTVGFQPTSFTEAQEEAYFARRMQYRTSEASKALSAQLAGDLVNSIVERKAGNKEKAEEYLNHMRQIYRQAAKNYDDQSVPLDQRVKPPSIKSVTERAKLMLNPELSVQKARKTQRQGLSRLYNVMPSSSEE